MRFVEISKPLVTKIISESFLLEAKNTHMEHLEDNIFNKGYAGAKEAVDYLYSLHQMLDGHGKSKMDMTIKWDGAPALVCGKDPQTGKFFVGTKGVFAGKAKLNFTEKDIEENHADRGENSGEGLRVKLRLALKTLGKLNWDTVAQGDMMFMKGDIKEISYDGIQYIMFKPNTLAYAVPKDSDLAKQMLSAEIGMVWHTEYSGGPTLADTSASFGFDASRLGDGSNAGVWQTDANIKNLAGTVTMTAEESAEVLSSIKAADAYTKQIGSDVFNWLQTGNDLVGKEFLQQLKATVNNKVRAGDFGSPESLAKEFVVKWIDKATKDIDKVKMQKTKDVKIEKMVKTVAFIKEHVKEITAVYDLYLMLIKSKIIVMRKIANLQTTQTFAQEGDDFVPTSGEGFVAIDRLGNAIKLVDRMEFSRLNFGTGKPGA
jgi:hypothetical protein|tara:strand:- start:2770 stop:4059 length:1290 start_codon:yes stop_codon:yes gene_type:complete